MRATTALASLFATAVLACGTPAPSDPDAGVAADAPVLPPPEVELSVGTVRGARGPGYQEFLGIPYAEAPVGDLRWRAPVAAAPWTETRDATREGEACPQEALGLAAAGEEDCLYLNVHAPDPLPENAPVLVWIHGGAFVFGEGGQTDGGTAGDLLAARHGLVVVSMNYRLGAFGFFPSDALGSSGNEGFQDQQLALEWVRDHIADFGGNPDDVTIAGESAGGLSVCLHMVAPRSQGLFARVISQSGLCDQPLPTRDVQVGIDAAVITSAGCDGASDVGACMRGKTLEDIRAAGALGGDVLDILSGQERLWWPNVDGTILPGQVSERIASGDAADVPVLMGWNQDEGTLFVGLTEMQGGVVDEAAYHTVIAAVALRHSLEASEIEAAYPLADYDDAGFALAAALGHGELACPSRRAARAMVEQGMDVHVYHFEYPDAGFQLMTDRDLGAFHSAEIQFVFGHPARLGRSFATHERTLNEQISGYWARFARTSDPNGDGATAWPSFTLAGEESLRLDRTIAPGAAIDRDACALWDSGT